MKISFQKCYWSISLTKDWYGLGKIIDRHLTQYNIIDVQRQLLEKRFWITLPQIRESWRWFTCSSNLPSPKSTKNIINCIVIKVKKLCSASFKLNTWPQPSTKPWKKTYSRHRHGHFEFSRVTEKFKTPRTVRRLFFFHPSFTPQIRWSRTLLETRVLTLKYVRARTHCARSRTIYYLQYSRRRRPVVRTPRHR